MNPITTENTSVRGTKSDEKESVIHRNHSLSSDSKPRALHASRNVGYRTPSHVRRSEYDTGPILWKRRVRR